jgi:hypothetical protein
MKTSSTGNFNVWLCYALAGTVLLGATLPAWNVLVNPYQIFRVPATLWRHHSPSLNERFLKTEYLIGHPDKHDAFIVGSSLMGAIEPSAVKSYFPELRFYNLSFLAAKPDEILAALKLINSKGIALRTILYGLEPIAFSDAKVYGPAYRSHPIISGESYALYAFDYLFASSFVDGLNRFYNGLASTPFIRFDIEESGRYFLSKYDEEIIKDPIRYRKAHLLSETKTIAQPWVESRFDDFAALMRWLKQEKIAIQVYLNPLHPHIAEGYGTARLKEFKRRIENTPGIGLVRDCTEILDADADGAFYDLKHFRPEQAGRVLGCAMDHQVLRHFPS